MSKRRTYSREYKLAAVKKVVEQGMSYCEVARDLGIRDTLIHSWRKAFAADGTLNAQANGNPSPHTLPDPYSMRTSGLVEAGAYCINNLR